MRAFWRTPSAKLLRATVIAAVTLLPLLTVWNLAAKSVAPNWQVKFGPPLRGVTVEEAPAAFSLRALIDGSLQKSISNAVTEAIPVRPLLIRLSNSFRKRLFGLYGAPGVVAGDDGHLIEQVYLTEYCARDLAVLKGKTAAWIPRLRELQDFYAKRGAIFIYLTTPSKVTHLPEKFVGYVQCNSSKIDRDEYLPLYRRMLTDASVPLVDGAGLTHSLKGRYEIDVFPIGGVHWNELGVAHAADAVLAEINRRAGHAVAPRLSWTWEITDRPTGTDTDLIDVVNVLFARPRYPTAKVHYDAGAPCSEYPASRMRVALIGGSFIHQLGRTLSSAGCLQALEGYNYLYRSRHQGPDFRTVEKNLSESDIVSLRDADIVILEENESLLPTARHAAEFHRIIIGR